MISIIIIFRIFELNNNKMGEIRIIQPCTDSVANTQLKVGDIVNLGAERNKNAVAKGLAVHVDLKKTEKVSQEEVSKGKADLTQFTGEKSKVDLAGKYIQNKVSKNRK